VLDVGCGTGRFALALAERGARVWGVDPSDEMLAQARGNTGGKVALKRARAEALPFKGGWFDRVLFRLVVHLVDRPRAFEEAARVLAPRGRIVVATFALESFDRIWVAQAVPQVAELDRARFPGEDELIRELVAAGFEGVRTRRIVQSSRLSRAEALERLRGRYISTLRLLDEDTFAEGLARAERQLPGVVEDEREWLVAVAERG
jgi:ubiquinone/menaquinone biosynthesis C-methylase UbiE